jgi:O-antigen ligase
VLEVAFGEETVDRTQFFFSVFPSPIVVWPLSKMLSAWECCWSAKQIQLLTKGRTLSLKREEWPSVNLLTFWESYLRHVRACWKTDRMYVRFVPNLCFFFCANFRLKTKMTCATVSLLTTVCFVWLLFHLTQHQNSQNGVEGKDIR